MTTTATTPRTDWSVWDRKPGPIAYENVMDDVADLLVWANKITHREAQCMAHEAAGLAWEQYGGADLLFWTFEIDGLRLTAELSGEHLGTPYLTVQLAPPERPSLYWGTFDR